MPVLGKIYSINRNAVLDELTYGILVKLKLVTVPVECGTLPDGFGARTIWANFFTASRVKLFFFSKEIGETLAMRVECLFTFGGTTCLFELDLVGLTDRAEVFRLGISLGVAGQGKHSLSNCVTSASAHYVSKFIECHSG